MSQSWPGEGNENLWTAIWVQGMNSGSGVSSLELRARKCRCPTCPQFRSTCTREDPAWQKDLSDLNLKLETSIRDKSES